VKAGDADAFVVQYHTHSVKYGTKASLGIGDHGDADGAAYAFELHNHLREGAQSKIWITERTG
jgi:hypothetical protein